MNGSYFHHGHTGHLLKSRAAFNRIACNRLLVSYRAEGYRWPVNEIELVHNTLVDDLPESGVYLRVSPGPVAVRIVSNLLAGRASWNIGTNATFQNNVTLRRTEIGTTLGEAYHPGPDALARVRGAGVSTVNGAPLIPDRQYFHPRSTIALRAPPSIAGALQPEPSASR